MAMQLPEIMLGQDFQSLPDSTKVRIATAIANSGQQQGAQLCTIINLLSHVALGLPKGNNQERKEDDEYGFAT